ncbi:O-antigen ligase family protein [Dactylococcopsis salina]|uniref:Lipid A core-O-antigen ligase-like enyme n=1 Tax=Dactylococcopsis salina (strain PCC 8305) TaxID=13035 RepID=K9YVQ3_DACS8|nr:O-antigen ligase family protein [Dactylococcopsis salina]AFZ51006.1 lipid A core-O-antigen ligase-like enyme [Dactylococcopsis salina PCC 8305]
MTAETTPTWRGQYLGWIGLASLIFFNVFPSAYVQMVNFPHILVWQIGFFCLGIWGIWMLRQFNVPFQPLGYGLDWGVGLILLALILSVSFADFKEVAAYNFAMALGYGVLLYTLRNWFALAPLSKGGWGDPYAAQVDQNGITWQKVWQGLCILGSIIGIVSLVLWLISCFQEEGFQFVRNAYPIGNPNWTTSYFLLILPLVFAYSLSVQGWQRWLGFFCSVELLAVFYTTGSRGGLLGFFTLLVAGIILVWIKGKKEQKRRLIIGIISLILVSLIFLGTNPKVQRLFTAETTSNQSSIVDLSQANSIMTRLRMWQAGLNILQDRPLVGVGIGNMSRVYNLYNPIEAGPRISNVQGLHSTPIQILGEMGIIGFTAVTIFVGFVIRLWYRLYCNLSQPRARYLLYGIGGGLLAYGGSVLTEYQLENIGISGTLVVILVLLLGLADEAALEKVSPLTIASRRGVSLVSIGLLGLACLASFPLTIAMGVYEQGESLLEQDQRRQAFDPMATASEIVPWHPVYSIHLGKTFFSFRREAESDQEFQELSEIAISYLKQGIKASPYDQWFHHELGLTAYPINPKLAEESFTRMVQLLPRGNFYDYYLLALAYLENDQPQDKIITALALQGLVRPEFLTFPVWENYEKLSPLKEAVLERTLTYLGTLQDRLAPDTEEYNRVYERQVLLKWWHEQALEGIEMSRLRPTIQALLIAETSREKALRITQSALAETPESGSLLLLRAWLNPDQFLETYLQKSEQLSLEEAQAIEEHIKEDTEIRTWLTSLEPKLISSMTRRALIYTYRNYHVQLIGLVSLTNLSEHRLAVSLELFPKYPPHISQLERLINEIQTKKLDIIHPTENNFKVR